MEKGTGAIEAIESKYKRINHKAGSRKLPALTFAILYLWFVLPKFEIRISE